MYIKTEMRGKTRLKAITGIMLILLLVGMLYTALNVRPVTSWSNGGFSTNPENPNYGTHDWVAQHALDWLPTEEKQYILDNLTAYLYGTELPDNPAGIGDVINHHIYYWSNGSLQNDASAVRAYEEYNNTLNFLRSGDLANASKTAGIMSHYLVDVAVFGHVMGADTDWGAEQHHSDYEDYVNQRTSNYSAEFNMYLSFDGELSIISAYDAAKELAYDTTFDIDGNLTCVWMDQNYNWDDPVFKDRCGESLNLAVNYLADALHTLYLETRIFYVDPPRSCAAVGEVFSINVSVTNVKYLYTWQFFLNWDPSLLNATSVTEGPFLNQNNTLPTRFVSKVNNTLGEIRAVNTLLGVDVFDAPSGNGTLATVTFLVKAEGECPLHLSNTQLIRYTSPFGDPILMVHTVEDGTWVIPEFPSAIILPILMILSLISIVFMKLKKKKQ